MNKPLLYLLLFFVGFQGMAQKITGTQLLEKTMQFHDPSGTWKTFKGTLHITMETPNSPNRDSEVNIDLPKQYFYVKATTGGNDPRQLGRWSSLILQSHPDHRTRIVSPTMWAKATQSSWGQFINNN